MNKAQPSLDWINTAPEALQWFARFLVENWIPLLQRAALTREQFAVACDAMNAALPRLLQNLSGLSTWRAQLRQFNKEAEKYHLPVPSPDYVALRVRLRLKEIAKLNREPNTAAAKLDDAALWASPMRNLKATDRLIESQMGYAVAMKHYPNDRGLRDDLVEVALQFSTEGFSDVSSLASRLAEAHASLRDLRRFFELLESVSLENKRKSKRVVGGPLRRKSAARKTFHLMCSALNALSKQCSISAECEMPTAANASSKLAVAVRELGAVEPTRFIMRALGAWPKLPAGMPFDPDACLEIVRGKLRVGDTALPQDKHRLILETIVRCEELRTALLRLYHADAGQRKKRLRAALLAILNHVFQPYAYQRTDDAVVLGEPYLQGNTVVKAAERIDKLLKRGRGSNESTETEVRNAYRKYGLK